MKQRILALILITVMAIGLVGCKGKKEAVTLTSTVEQLNDMKTGEYSYDISVKGTGEEFAVMPMAGVDVKLTGVTEKENLGNAVISYKLDGETEYSTLTDMVVSGTDIYLNIKQLKETLGKYNNEMITTYLAMIPDGKDYLKVTQDSLEALSGTVTTAAAPSVEEVESYMLAATHVSKFFEAATKDVEPKAIEVKDSKVTILLNNENAGAIINAILKSDIAAAIDAYVKEGEKIKGDKEQALVTQARDNKDTIVTSVKDALTEAKTSIDSTVATGEYKMTVGITGKKGDRKSDLDMAMKLSAEGTSMEMTMKGATNEKISDGKKVTIPESVITIEELIAAFSGL